jgi:hypothetical protein
MVRYCGKLCNSRNEKEQSLIQNIPAVVTGQTSKIVNVNKNWHGPLVCIKSENGFSYQVDEPIHNSTNRIK